MFADGPLGVQEVALSIRFAQRSAAGLLRFGGVVQLGGVLDEQHPRLGPHPLKNGLPMRLEDGLRRAPWMIQQAIGAHHFRPAMHGGGRTGQGALHQPGEDLSGTPIQASVSQVDRVQLVCKGLVHHLREAVGPARMSRKQEWSG